MAKYLLIAQSNAQPGREAEYTEWYDTHHIHDICSLSGVVSGHRYEVVPELFLGQPGSRYLAVYEIETDDPAAVLAELNQRARGGEFKMTDSIDGASANLWMYELRK